MGAEGVSILKTSQPGESPGWLMLQNLTNTLTICQMAKT
jgi:hypothetical protein